MALGDEPLGSLPLGTSVGINALQGTVLAGDVIVVYSLATGRIRRIVGSDIDDEVKSAGIGTGEGFLHVSKKDAGDQDKLQAMITALAGKTPTSDRYVIVQGSAVLGAILADPACNDAMPGCQLIQHDLADPRWTYNGSSFVPPEPTAEDIFYAAQAALRG